MIKDDNEEDLKNKEDLHIDGRYTALDIFRFAVFFLLKIEIHTQILHTPTIFKFSIKNTAKRNMSSAVFRQRSSSVKGRLP